MSLSVLLYYKIGDFSSLKSGKKGKNRKVMKKSAFISDILFSFVASCVPALCFLRYLRLSLPLASILSVLFAAAVSGFVWFILSKKQTKIVLKKGDEEEKEKWLQHLMLSGIENNLDYFFSALKILSSPPDKQWLAPLRITAFKTLGCIETEGAFFFVFFTFAPLDCDDAASVIRLDLPKEKHILCGKITPQAERLFSQFSLPILKENELFLTLRQANCLPEKYLGYFDKKKTIKTKSKVWFSKSNSKRFFGGGILLLLTSLLTPFPLYYLIFGSAMILSSVFIRIFGYR
jgi:hypothetical protein